MKTKIAWSHIITDTKDQMGRNLLSQTIVGAVRSKMLYKRYFFSFIENMYILITQAVLIHYLVPFGYLLILIKI